MSRVESCKISDFWEGFKEDTIPKDAGEGQIHDMRASFYAGALTMMEINLRITKLPDDEGVAILDGCMKEGEDFYNELMARANAVSQKG